MTLPGVRAPTIRIGHGSSPAPTMMCAVPGGQWKKSHWRSRRSSPSTTRMHSPASTRKPSWSDSAW